MEDRVLISQALCQQNNKAEAANCQMKQTSSSVAEGAEYSGWIISAFHLLFSGL